AERVANARGSFEGWLRGELIIWLRDFVVQGDLGVEYTARLKGKGRQQKRVDLWVKAKGTGKRWHYIELKVVFKNANMKKQLAGWQDDLNALAALDPSEGAAGVASFAVGVGFSASEWKRQAGEGRVVATGNRKSDLRLAVLPK
ncbi:MAG: hypothetical protein IT378_22395, partial [Sandaracinaceae bacterium]|nr:hypothetical protein [Sandaracinaceae bacterium]